MHERRSLPFEDAASKAFDWPQKQAERMASVPYATGGLPPPEVAARNAISRKPGAYIKDPVRYKTQMCQNFMARGKCPLQQEVSVRARR